jgi:hypothetical protein
MHSSQRLGKAHKADPDERFWKVLKGSKKDVRPPIDDEDDLDSDFDVDKNGNQSPGKG